MVASVHQADTDKRGGFGAFVEWHGSVASTMPLAHALASRSKIRSGAAIVADEQTAGKGRQGRRWESPPGRSLMVSFMLRHVEHSIPLDRLGMVAALGVLEACAETGISRSRLRCKWPNDIVVSSTQGAPRKVAGILIETRLLDGWWDHAVIGIGINVNQTQQDLPSVSENALPPWSLRLALAEQENTETTEIDRTRLFDTLCRSLDRTAGLDADAIFDLWRAQLWMPDGEVALWQENSLIARGIIAGVDTQGHLLLRTEEGDVTAFPAGDLSLRLA